MARNPRKYRPTPTIDFLGRRRVFGMISAVLSVAALMLIFYPGPNYNIDFTGGTNVMVKFDGPVDSADIRSAMSGIGMEDAAALQMGGETSGEYIISTSATTTISSVQREEVASLLKESFGDSTEIIGDESSGDRFYVRLPFDAYGLSDSEDENHPLNAYTDKNEELVQRIDGALASASIPNSSASVWGNPTDRRYVVRVQGIHNTVEQALQDQFGATFLGMERTETVGPRVGEQLRAAAVTAVIWAMLLILVYIAFRFELRYAPAAVLGQIHDVLIVLGIIVIFRIEFSLTIIAALLTIVGYSLNDTIVNFDRIRENIDNGDLQKESLVQLVNRSINECLSRTVLTSVTTFAALIAIVIFGGPIIRPFAVVMAAGIVVGTYSSIFIASPLMVWTSKEMDKRGVGKERKPRVSKDPVV